jgi:hypothetical protein
MKLKTNIETKQKDMVMSISLKALLSDDEIAPTFLTIIEQ